MSKKKHKSRAAALGTAAGPRFKEGRSGREDADRLRRKAQESVRSSQKLVGVMPEQMAEDIRETGSYPFTFKSAFIIAAAALLGTIAIPFLASQAGIWIGLSTLMSLPLLLAASLAYTRYFVDSRRGWCRGFAVTFLVAFVACAAVVWLLFYQGIML